MAGTRPEYHRGYYKQNREKYRDAKNRSVQKLQEYIRGVKNVPCMDCGVRYHWFVMDLDHRDRSTKEIQPARMTLSGWSLERAKLEVAKCDAVCSNCHRIRTAKQIGIIGV